MNSFIFNLSFQACLPNLSLSFSLSLICARSGESSLHPFFRFLSVVASICALPPHPASFYRRFSVSVLCPFSTVRSLRSLPLKLQFSRMRPLDPRLLIYYPHLRRFRPRCTRLFGFSSFFALVPYLRLRCIQLFGFLRFPRLFHF